MCHLDVFKERDAEKVEAKKRKILKGREFMEWHGIPREKIPWYPSINYENCQGCKECYDFWRR